ncbi:MAG: multiheme c-type cytochrome [Bacteroidota bacterium]|nr:multiheme c-type cytochrome [Bacteroidota bacterium]
MAQAKNIALALFLLVAFMLIFWSCGDQSEPAKEKFLYRNHSDSAKYLGSEACKGCHADKYETFMQTGMGQSFGLATPQKSAGKFTGHEVLYDKFLDLYYAPHFVGNELYILEFKLQGKDTIHKRDQKIKYIIGSGHHTNSHIIESNGYLYQAPLTFYTQEGKWDLPPGFENGANSRFSRIIGHECMSCHNSLPDYVQGSENQFTNIPLGIGCERCHGPGSLHVSDKQKGILVDTKNNIDYSIVNPRKLPWQLQIDVCQRCHLQGNTVLKQGKDWQSFRPGMKLSDVMDVFLPRYADDENRFYMASHAVRLQMSPCFLKSNPDLNDNNNLKLTCITCHNPHVSTRQTGKEQYNTACKNCHSNAVKNTCTENILIRNKVQDNCVQCHMPKNGSSDIPHVSVTDHYIRKKVGNTTSNTTNTFKGLRCVNNREVADIAAAVAYLNSYEKDNNKNHTLDSAAYYIKKMGKENPELKIRELYISQKYAELINYMQINKIISADAWTNYRLGIAFLEKGDMNSAVSWLENAVRFAAKNLEFQQKLGIVYIATGNTARGKDILEKLLLINPAMPVTWYNMAMVAGKENNISLAETCLHKCIYYDPNHIQALINLANISEKKNDTVNLKKYILRLRKLQPNNKQWSVGL